MFLLAPIIYTCKFGWIPWSGSSLFAHAVSNSFPKRLSSFHSLEQSAFENSNETIPFIALVYS